MLRSTNAAPRSHPVGGGGVASLAEVDRDRLLQRDHVALADNLGRAALGSLGAEASVADAVVVPAPGDRLSPAVADEQELVFPAATPHRALGHTPSIWTGN